MVKTLKSFQKSPVQGDFCYNVFIMNTLDKENLKQENSVAKLLVAGILIIVILLGMRNNTFVKKQPQSQQQLTSDQKAAQEQEILKSILVRVGKHITLPEGVPQFAVVQDQTKAQQQLFLKNAQNGDILVVYPTMAILYSPKLDKIVNVGPVSGNLTGGSQDPSTSNTQPAVEEGTQQTVSFDIRNGTYVKGLADNWLKAHVKASKTVVTKTGNATVKPVVTTYAVINNPNVSQSQVLGLFSVPTQVMFKTLSELPKNEASSKADVLIILGEDAK